MRPIEIRSRAEKPGAAGATPRPAVTFRPCSPAARPGRLGRLGRLGIAAFALTAWLPFLSTATRTHAQSVPSGAFTEPATVFYGKITGTASDRPFPVTKGELLWTIRRADGTELALRTRLHPIGDSEFVYRLNVPHEALAAGLAVQPRSVPLKANAETHQHVRISVDGELARVAEPGGLDFDVAQARRAAAYRLDLEVPLTAADSDGDGVPDWWEELHGLNESDNDDPDGDGISNRMEYLAGTNPREDGRSPTLATRSIQAYADGTTGVYLRAIDSDSPAEAVLYTLASAPAGSELRLRNVPASGLQPDLGVRLEAGATFTQADVQKGRLVLVHEGGEVLATEFAVTLRDSPEAPATEPSTISVSFHLPPADVLLELTPAERHGIVWGASLPPRLEGSQGAKLRRYLQAVDRGAVIWDLSADGIGVQLGSPAAGIPAPGSLGPRDLPQVMQGGYGADRFHGGFAGDVLAGGSGDDWLAGGPGGDSFVFQAGDTGNDVVADFEVEGGDVLDLRGFFAGLTGDLRPHLEIGVEEGTSVLKIRRDATRAAFDLAIRLPSVAPAALDLRRWLDAGALNVGALDLPPTVSWESTQAHATENGPGEGKLVVRRSGSATGTLVVPVSFNGSAVNGRDFASLPAAITFAPGESTALVVIRPFADSEAEPEETVEVSLEDSADFVVAGPKVARISIADLLPVITIEALEPVATLQPVAQGTFLLRREALIDRSVLVRLDIRGSASAGSDYGSLSRFVNFTPGQATALIPVVPQAGAELDPATGAETVEVLIAEDPAYLRGSGHSAQVLLVRQATRFADWRAAHFPGFTGSMESFANTDSGNTGISNLLRYAFGMDPLQPDKTQLPKIVVRDGHLTVDVWRRPGATDVDVVAELSTDLGRWSSAPGRVERIYPAERAGDAGYMRLRATPSIAEAPHLFLNIRVVFRP